MSRKTLATEALGRDRWSGAQTTQAGMGRKQISNPSPKTIQ
jgi:hypothetical protein